MSVRPVGLLRRRARSRAGVLVVLGLLVATISGVGGAVVVAAGASAEATAREALGTAPDDGAALVVRTRLGADPAAQQGALDGALAARFGHVPLAVDRALVSPPLRLADGSGTRVVLRTSSGDGAGDTDPSLAAGPGEVAVGEEAAAELGLTAGDVLALEHGDLVVTTVADDVLDAAVRSPGAAVDAEPGVHGPLLVAEDTLLGLDAAPFVEWDVRPVVDAVALEDLAVLVAGGTALEPVLTRVDGLAERGLTVDGDLPGTAARAAQAAQTVRATGLVPVVLLAVVAVVALRQVVRLLVRARTGEVGVLVGRGADPARLVRWAGVEATVVAGAGAVGGAVVAALVAGGGRPDAAHLPAVAVTALVTAAVAVGVTVTTSARQVRSFVRVDPPVRRARLRTVTTVGSFVGAPAVAALTSWRLLRADGVRADGASSTDLLAVAAPAAALVALAVVGMLLLVPAARAGELLTTRRRPLVPAYVARQVARRSGEHAVAAVLLVLAVGTVSVTAVYAASVTRHRGDLAALDTGSDVRVLLPAEATVRSLDAAASSSVPFAELDGVTAAASVVRARASVADREVALTALPVARADAVVRAPVDLGAHAGELTGPLAGADLRPRLPADAHTLELALRVGTGPGDGSPDVAGTSGPAAVDVAVWLADADGGLTRVDLGSVATTASDADPAVLRADLPAHGPHHLAAVDVGLRAAGGALEVDVVRLAVEAADGTTEAALPGTPWQVAPAVTTGAVGAGATDALGVRATLDGTAERPVPALVRLVPPTGDAVPVVVTDALAARAALAPGDRVRATLAGPEVVLQVVGVVDAVPGALDAEAVLADLGALGQGLLQGRRTPVLPTETWLALDDGAAPDVVAAEATALAGPDARATTARAEVTDAAGPVVDAFWTAATTAVLLALAGVAAVAVALVRARRGEVVVLRAVGQTPLAQARARAAEHLAVAVPALVAGALAGVATSLLLVPALVRSTVLTAGPVPVRLAADAAGAGALVLVLVLGLAAVAVGVALRVRGQALDREHREEVA